MRSISDGLIRRAVLALTALACVGLAPALGQAPAVVPPSTLGEERPPAAETAPPAASPARPEQRQQRRQQTRRQPAAPVRSTFDRMVEQANANTVTVVSGTVNGSYIQLANDMSFVLDEADKLRVLPVIGRGGYENIYDIVLLKGIDVGLVRSDAVEIAKREGRVPDIAQRLAYIAPLTNDELHIVASKTITSIEQLRGKRVNFDLKGSGSELSGRMVFERLGIEVQASNHDSGTAYGMVARGELDAALFMSLKPVRAIANIPASANLHLLEVPYDKRLEDVYYPASFTSAEYPNLVSAGRESSTIAAKTILVTYNWQAGSERYLRVQRFVDAFFSKLDEFRKPNRHPKWQEVNLAATFTGLPRFKPAKDWLDRQQATASTPSPASPEAQRRQFEQFMSQQPPGRAQNAPGDRERLFEEFTRWQRSRVQ
jgi:uncharacterized protein